jgi:hypothetical protein
MSLYWPPTAAQVVADEPRLHALVIGVGDYHHLGLNVAAPARLLNGLAPLTITTPAARRITRWLETDYRNPDVPLGSVELLLSPSEQMDRSDGGSADVADATMANVEQAFKRWYTRCDSDEGNIAFFYFAGHGIATLGSQFLLPSDFGNPTEPNDWENCIDAIGLQTGMRKNKADTQLFFLDACRDVDISALTQRNPQGKHLVSSSLNDNVKVSAAFRAASDGRKAYGKDGEETYFCKALMLCLDGVAAHRSGPDWKIDTARLASDLVSVIDIIAKTENQPLTSQCDALSPAPFHTPAQPKVLVKVSCEPADRNKEATIVLKQDNAEILSAAGERRPWMTSKAIPGDAHLEATFTNFPSCEIDAQLDPPTYEWDPPDE